MNEILGLIQGLMPYALVVGAAYLLWRFGGGLISGLGTSLGGAFGGVVPALAIFGIVVVAAFAVIVIWQPTFFTTMVGSRGPFGPDRRIADAKADSVIVALDPTINSALLPSAPARAVADNVVSELELATAKNNARISAAEAERLAHLPKGHPDRAKWDAAGMDPAAGAASSAEQRIKNTTGEVVKNAGDEIRKIDFTATDRELSKPWGQAPPDAETAGLKWLYNMPKGIPAMIMLIVVAAVLIKTLRALLRA